jgi:hypothetical protein
MPSQATVTAKVGPAIQATSLVINNVLGYEVDLTGRWLQVRTSDQPNRVLEFDMVGVTTFTTSISGANWTLTIS